MTLILLLVSAVGLGGMDGQPSQRVYLPGDGVTLPRVLSQVIAPYTPEAMRLKISGAILLEGVVQVDGTVTDVRVVRPLDPGLDQEAVNAFKRWRFSPGLKDGEAVAVQITAEMVFVMDMRRVPGGAPIVVFSRSERDGSKLSFEISQERFQRLAGWVSDLDPSVPLSVDDAIEIASDWVNRKHQKQGAPPYRLVDATIARIGARDSDRWYYKVDFASAERTDVPGADVVTAIVLLDGSIVEPSAEKQTRLSR